MLNFRWKMQMQIDKNNWLTITAYGNEGVTAPVAHVRGAEEGQTGAERQLERLLFCIVCMGIGHRVHERGGQSGRAQVAGERDAGESERSRKRRSVGDQGKVALGQRGRGRVAHQRPAAIAHLGVQGGQDGVKVGRYEVTRQPIERIEDARQPHAEQVEALASALLQLVVLVQALANVVAHPAALAQVVEERMAEVVERALLVEDVEEADEAAVDERSVAGHLVHVRADLFARLLGRAAEEEYVELVVGERRDDLVDVGQVAGLGRSSQLANRRVQEGQHVTGRLVQAHGQAEHRAGRKVLEVHAAALAVVVDASDVVAGRQLAAELAQLELVVAQTADHAGRRRRRRRV